MLARAATAPPLTFAQLADFAHERRGARGLTKSNFEPTALTGLARVVALQATDANDQHVSLELFDLALDLFGPGRLAPAAQGLHAQLAYRLGELERASELLSKYSGLKPIIRTTLGLDLATTAGLGRGGRSEKGARQRSLDTWLRSLAALMPPCELSLAGGSDCPPFDRLTAAPVAPVEGPERVSVIATTFQPDTSLLTAVRSLSNQSWTNLEILVIDDASPPEFSSVLDRCAELDERVRVVRLQDNRGTYVARNAGIDIARGDFITFADSDDWSHPERIALQLGPLRTRSDLMATISEGLLVRGDLTVTQAGLNPQSLAGSSVLLRREVVTEHVGYFHSLRKSADGEFLGRLPAALGPHALYRLAGTVLQLVRVRQQSLSRADFVGGHWIHPARFAYRSAYRRWHDRIRTGEAQPFVPKDSEEEPVPAPEHLRSPEGAPGAGRAYDIVFLGDWRGYSGMETALIEEVSSLMKCGYRVGLAHMENWQHLTESRLPLDPRIQRLIDEGTVDHCLPTIEPISVGLLIVQDPVVMQFVPGARLNLSVQRAVIRAHRPPKEATAGRVEYVPAVCESQCEDQFSVRPSWAPVDSTVSRALALAHVEPLNLLAGGLPEVIDTDAHCLRRRGPRLSGPVVGRHWHSRPPARENGKAAAFCEHPPDLGNLDVRLLADRGLDRKVLIPRASGWMRYASDEVSVWSFLHQLDFWLWGPVERNGTLPIAQSTEVVEALASGCVVVLPPRFSDSFGDAVLYREAEEVAETVGLYHSEHELFLEQSRRAQAWVEGRYGTEKYLDAISDLLPTESVEGGGIAQGGGAEEPRCGSTRWEGRRRGWN